MSLVLCHCKAQEELSLTYIGYQYKGTQNRSFLNSHPLKTIFQHKACTDKLYADSFYKVQKNSHSSFEVICCCS